jgi:AcrR family transcriptional regulator
VPRAGDRKPLSRDRVVAAALRLVDRRGLDALSMRRLGTALGVEAMSLYKHVPSKPALLELLVERVLADIAPPPVDAPWEPRLRHVVDELRRVSLAHPHVFPLLATRVPASPQALAPLEALLAALLDAGLDDAAAVRHFWTLIGWATGALLAETAAATGVGQANIALPPGLDASAFPAFARLGDRVAACDFAEEYARGLDVLIDAIGAARRVKRTSSRGTTASRVRRTPGRGSKIWEGARGTTREK